MGLNDNMHLQCAAKGHDACAVAGVGGTTGHTCACTHSDTDMLNDAPGTH